MEYNLQPVYIRDTTKQRLQELWAELNGYHKLPMPAAPTWQKATSYGVSVLVGFPPMDQIILDLMDYLEGKENKWKNTSL